MKSTLTWFAVITAALVAAGCIVLWINRRWRAAEKARARQTWKRLRQEVEERRRLSWENRPLIGFAACPVTAAS